MMDDIGHVDIGVFLDNDGNCRRFTYKWMGGKRVKITGELLRNSAKSQIQYPRFPPLPGDCIRFGIYRLRTLSYSTGVDVVTAIRDDRRSDVIRHLWHKLGDLVWKIFWRRRG